MFIAFVEFREKSIRSELIMISRIQPLKPDIFSSSMFFPPGKLSRCIY